MVLKSNIFEDLIDEDFSFYDVYLESDVGNFFCFRYGRVIGFFVKLVGFCKVNL